MQGNYDSIYDWSQRPSISPKNSSSSSENSTPSLAEKLVVGASYAGIALTFPISLPFCLKHVGENETAVVSRIGGSLKECNEAGYVLSIPGLDTFEKFSKSAQRFVIQPLKAITHDLYELVIQGQAAYRINDPLKLVRATQEGRENLIKECTNTTIKNICGKYNFNRISDVTLLRNEVLLEVNRHSMHTWGVQLITDEMSLRMEIIKRGEDGPGDPMEQIIKLVKEQFDTSGTQVAQGLSQVLNSSSKQQQLPEDLFPQYQLLQDVSKFTARKAEKAFKSLNNTTFKISLIDYPDFSFLVDGKDFENPVKLSDFQNCHTDVTIGIRSSDIPKLLQHEYDALKVWLAGNISISGTNDVNKAVSVGKFLRDLMS